MRTNRLRGKFDKMEKGEGFEYRWKRMRTRGGRRRSVSVSVGVYMHLFMYVIQWKFDKMGGEGFE